LTNQHNVVREDLLEELGIRTKFRLTKPLFECGNVISYCVHTNLSMRFSL
jgi:hypothetical protein